LKFPTSWGKSQPVAALVGTIVKGCGEKMKVFVLKNVDVNNSDKKYN